MTTIRANELQAMLNSGKPCIVIDVREAYELEICSLHNAVHIPMAFVRDNLAEIPEEGEVVILCKSGNRAMAVANWLITDFGRNNVRYLEGGILAWIEMVQPQLESY